MTKLVMVEELCTFRHRYVVELGDNDPPEWAEDSVVCKTPDDFHEFSQYHVGDQILSHRVISEEEYLTMFDKDNDYLKEWPTERKLAFINKPDK
jgi:hypothetical protein